MYVIAANAKLAAEKVLKTASEKAAVVTAVLPSTGYPYPAAASDFNTEAEDGNVAATLEASRSQLACKTIDDDQEGFFTECEGRGTDREPESEVDPPREPESEFDGTQSELEPTAKTHWPRLSKDRRPPHISRSPASREKAIMTGLQRFVQERRTHCSRGRSGRIRALGEAPPTVPLGIGPITPPDRSRTPDKNVVTNLDSELDRSLSAHVAQQKMRQLSQSLDRCKLSVLFPGFVMDRLHQCLQEIRQLPTAEPFLVLPWKDPSLSKFLEVTSDPVDLKTIGQRLVEGRYEAVNGDVCADLFWGDIGRCWENCKSFHAGKEASEPYVFADECQKATEAIEEKFWEDLSEMDPALQDLDGRWTQYRNTVDWDSLLHGWAREYLRKCLQALKSQPSAKSFLSPVPWKELGMDDYLEVISEPIDLETISNNMVDGHYERAEGGPDTAKFWADVRRIWYNCKRYVEEDEDLVDYKLADTMQRFGAKLEERFHGEFLEVQPPEQAKAPVAPAILVTDSTTAGLVFAQHAEEDQLIHNWCKKQLRACLQTLMAQHPQIDALEDVADRLSRGVFENVVDGFIDPELLWEAIHQTWEDSGSQSTAQDDAKELQDKFWRALEKFEISIKEVEMTLTSKTVS